MSSSYCHNTIHKALENSLMCLCIRWLKDLESEWAQPGSLLQLGSGSVASNSLEEGTSWGNSSLQFQTCKRGIMAIHVYQLSAAIISTYFLLVKVSHVVGNTRAPFILQIWTSESRIQVCDQQLNLHFDCMSIMFRAQSLSFVWPFATPWTVACQTPLSMGFSRQAYWSGLPFSFPVTV